jgi:hypothetical protein
MAIQMARAFDGSFGGWLQSNYFGGVGFRGWLQSNYFGGVGLIEYFLYKVYDFHSNPNSAPVGTAPVGTKSTPMNEAQRCHPQVSPPELWICFDRGDKAVPGLQAAVPKCRKQCNQASRPYHGHPLTGGALCVANRLM